MTRNSLTLTRVFFVAAGCLICSDSFVMNASKDLELTSSDDEADSAKSCGWMKYNGANRLSNFMLSNQAAPDICVIPPEWRTTCTLKQLSVVFGGSCLKPFDPAGFLKKINGMTLSFIGDSLTGQQFRELVCQLLPQGVARVEQPEAKVDDNNFGFHRIEFDGNTVIQFHFVATHAGEIADARILDADWIVFNIGSHAESWVEQEAGLRTFMKLFGEQRNADRLIFREYSPSHFNHKGPLPHMPEGLPEGYQCSNQAGPWDTEEKETMRRHLSNDFMDKQGARLLKVYDVSSKAWQQHVGMQAFNSGKDCRHWCTPSPVIDVWNRALSAMVR